MTFSSKKKKQRKIFHTGKNLEVKTAEKERDRERSCNHEKIQHNSNNVSLLIRSDLKGSARQCGRKRRT